MWALMGDGVWQLLLLLQSVGLFVSSFQLRPCDRRRPTAPATYSPQWKALEEVWGTCTEIIKSSKPLTFSSICTSRPHGAGGQLSSIQLAEAKQGSERAVPVSGLGDTQHSLKFTAQVNLLLMYTFPNQELVLFFWKVWSLNTHNDA